MKPPFLNHVFLVLFKKHKFFSTSRIPLILLLISTFILTLSIQAQENNKKITVNLAKQCDCDTAFILNDTLLVIDKDTINLSKLDTHLDSVVKKGDTLYFYVEDKPIDKVASGTDHDFYEVGQNSAPDDIGDNIWTQGSLAIGDATGVIGKGTFAGGENSFAGGTNSLASGSHSFAMGYYDTAKGAYSVALGSENYTGGINKPDIISDASIAIGYKNRSTTFGSITLGRENIAKSLKAVAIGGGNVASRENALAFGYNNKSDHISTVAIGTNNQALFYNAIAIGRGNIAKRTTDVALGRENVAEGKYSFAVGYKNKASGLTSIAMGSENKATNIHAFVAGEASVASGPYSIAMGKASVASGPYSIAMGKASVASDPYSIAMGDTVRSTNIGSFAAGRHNISSGFGSVALGSDNIAKGNGSVAMGIDCETVASYSVAMGIESKTSRGATAAFGTSCRAAAVNAIAMGHHCSATGSNAIAMGDENHATGAHSTAMGKANVASGIGSTAMGDHCIASGELSIAMGYNLEVSGKNSVGFRLEKQQTKPVVTQDNTMAIVGGNLGVGLVSPDERLHVHGRVKINTMDKVTASDSIVVWKDRVLKYISVSDLGINRMNSNIRPAHNFYKSGTTQVSDNISDNISDNVWTQGSISFGNATGVSGTGTYADGLNSLAGGTDAVAGGMNSFSMGQSTTAEGNNAVAIGHLVNIPHTGSFGFSGVTNTGTFKLESSADNQMNMYFGGGYRLYTSPDVGVSLTGTSWNQISDKRVKENLRKLSYGLAAVMKLRPYTFTYKGTERLSIGFIAQEVQQVVPEVVKSADMGPEKDYLGITYTELIPILTKAVQELKAENEALKKRIEALEKNAE